MIIDNDIEARSNAQLIAEVGGRFKEYRIFSNLTQREVAERSGVSVFTISQFEKGNARNITFGNFLALLRCIGFLGEVEKLLPPLPVMPYQMKKPSNKRERIRHEK